MENETRNNLLAGMADCFWYEWTVGVSYALDMLNPDCDTEYVILQASEYQGLDDVVIGHKDGSKTGIQVKHSRENGSITFSDLIYSGETNMSLLRELYVDWKVMCNNNYNLCQAILLTNRKGGSRCSTIGKKTSTAYKSPVLRKFWSKIKQFLAENPEAQIDDIPINKEFKTAWEKFLYELRPGDDRERILFIRNLEIKTEQEDLDGYVKEVHRKLSEYFKVDEQLIINLDQKLCYALRAWTTTRRKHERITREDLFEAFSLAQDIPVGDHNLPICNPFFSERISFVEELERKLVNREKPIIFLTGDPGTGKTNIVNYLANKAETVITLRFHAYRPVQPGESYVPLDQGISEAKALWGDLLIQLRELLHGQLAKYSVPISNEILGDYKRIQNEVLRIADLYGQEQETPTIIAIDGIDHAARAGENNNFLKTLVPPDSLPSNVCMLIAGQPLESYDLYPDWLSDENKVCKCEVPGIQQKDIIQLLENDKIVVEDCSVERLAEIIGTHVKGNTLSAVFAVYECRNLVTVADIEERLTKAAFADGIQAYYEYIWKMAKKQIPKEHWYVDTMIATMLTMYTKKITAHQMKEVFSEVNLAEVVWKRIFSSMAPLIVYDNGGYRIFHNDVRIYLQRYLKKDIMGYQDACLKLATYLLDSSSDIDARHELGFQLLKSAAHKELYSRYFTTEYILEAICHKRPLNEIYSQLEDVICQLDKCKDIYEIANIACAVVTLKQYQQSLQYHERIHIENKCLPIILPCEKRVLKKQLFEARSLRAVLEEVWWLIEENRIDRAALVLRRWLGKNSPYSLVKQLAQNDKQIFDAEYISNDKITGLLQEWGKVAYWIECPNWVMEEPEDENCKCIYAYWGRGWLDAAKDCGLTDFISKKQDLNTIFFKSDMEKIFLTCLKKWDKNQVLSYAKQLDIDNFSFETKIIWATWTVMHNEAELCENILYEILENKISLIKKCNSEKIRGKKIFCCGTMVAFIYSLYDQFHISEFDQYVSELLELTKGYLVKKKDSGYYSGNNLVLSGILMANVLKGTYNKKENNLKESIDIILQSIFDDQDKIGCIEIGGTAAQKWLLSCLIFLSDKLSEMYNQYILEQIAGKVKNIDSLALIELWWPYLKKRGRIDDLFDIFSKWMNLKDGKAWLNPVSELHDIGDVLIPLARDLGWNSNVQKIEDTLNYCKIGYMESKDDSLELSLKLFSNINRSERCWRTYGIQLLNISDYASRTGDNTDAVGIEGAIATAVGYKGLKEIASFMRTIKPRKIQEFMIVLNAIIESFSNNFILDEDIVLIWETVVDILNIDKSMPEYNSDNSLKIIYLVDLRMAIFKYLENHIQENNEQIVKSIMKNYAPFEYSVEKGIETLLFYLPERWFNKDISNARAKDFENENSMKSIEEVFENIQHLIAQNKQSQWDSAIGFVNLSRKHPMQSQKLIRELFNLIINCRRTEYWVTDGVDRLLDEIWNFLNASEKTLIYKMLIEHYQLCKQHSDNPELYWFSRELNEILYWEFRLIDNKEKEHILETILNMHMQWITASGHRAFVQKYISSEEESDLTWKTFCVELKEHMKINKTL